MIDSDWPALPYPPPKWTPGERAWRRARGRLATAGKPYLLPSGPVMIPPPPPCVEMIPAPNRALDMVRDMRREAFIDFQVTGAVLAMSRGLPFDSTLLKGLIPNVC